MLLFKTIIYLRYGFLFFDHNFFLNFYCLCYIIYIIIKGYILIRFNFRKDYTENEIKCCIS